MKKSKSKIMIIICVAILLMATGYAAFSTVLTITGTANIGSEWKVVFTNIQEESKTSGVNVKATPQASGTTATFNVGLTSPGDKIVYIITLSNQGTLDAIIKDIQASATDSPAIIFSVEDINIGDELAPKTDKYFKVIIEYDPNVTTQPEKLQKTLTVSIVTEQKVNQNIEGSTPSVDQPMYLSSAILNHNTAYADTNLDFSKTSEETETNGLYYTNVNTEDNEVTYYFRGDVQNNYVKFGKSSGCGYNGQAVFHVEDIQNQTATIAPTEGQCLSTNVCDAGSIVKDNYGVDYRYVTGIDDATCSYLGGTPTGQKATYGNNTIDILWRIVRINEDGSVRLITQNSIGESSFNDQHNDNAYVGYMYGATGQSGTNAYSLTHANPNNSTIKTYIDNWYSTKTNLSTYLSTHLADSGFCNDRSVSSGTGTGIISSQYDAYNRVNINKIPQFACPNETNDLFTTKTSTKGNKALTYPIGLLTLDEAIYAGEGVDKESKNMYLRGAAFWVMSPERLVDIYEINGTEYAGGFAIVSAVSYDIGGAGSSLVSNAHGVRPVINLKSNAEVSGNGTKDNPYVIK